MAFIRCGGGVVKSSQVSNLQVEQILKTFHITWNNPDDINLMGVRIVYKTDSLPENENDGIVAYESDNEIPVDDITIDISVDANTEVYFRAFAWTYLNATRIYTDVLTGATASLVTVLIKDVIRFTESQDWVVPAGVSVVDVFAVGGGGSGGFGSGEYSGGGGGGGYTKTVKGLSVVPKTVIPITVGAGGVWTSSSAKTDGGTSSFGDYVVALGGKTAGRLNGADGGSGGGGTETDYGDGLRGGYDGANGIKGYYDGGKGQGTTTRAFEETDGELFAGGGGGGGGYGGAGGNGGGGAGSGGSKATDGTPNTGGGGGGTLSPDYKNCGKGGSGIVIVRWGYE